MPLMKGGSQDEAAEGFGEGLARIRPGPMTAKAVDAVVKQEGEYEGNEYLAEILAEYERDGLWDGKKGIGKVAFALLRRAGLI